MKIFITGASGFIGQRIIKSLLRSCVDVNLLATTCNRETGNRKQSDTRLHWVHADFTNTHETRQLLETFRPDICLHLAWYAEPGKYLTSQKNLLMMQSSLELIQIAGAVGCNRFIAAGTCAEYANQSHPLREDDCTSPSNLYSACKLAVCHIGHALAAEYDMAFSWGRIFYLFGPGEDERRVIPSVAYALLSGEHVQATSGEQTRDFLHVDDVASAFVTLCHNTSEGIYNISSGQPVTMRTLLEETGQIIGNPEMIQFGARQKNLFDPPYIVGNSHRLQNLGWAPQYSLHEGLERTVESYRRQFDQRSLSK